MATHRSCSAAATDPPGSPGQLRVAVRAAGANFADHLACVGLYPDAPKLPAVAGYEVAGTALRLSVMGSTRTGVGEMSPGRYTTAGYREIVNAATDSPAPRMR